jgi:uncharacterized protein (TIGR02145 family)
MKQWKWVLALLAIAVAQPAPAQSQKYYTGDGGKGIRLAVLEPVGKGLSADEQWMLSLVQGSICGDFNKYSGMTIIDRQNLEKIFAEWKEGMSGNYSDADRVKIGNLTNASHILTGSISKTKTVFMLELTVTDVASGERKASYPPTPVSTLALENLSATKTASGDLLGQLGVALTDAAQGELKQVANTARAQAETMLARGIAAQRQGTEVAALSYFFQAADLDASLVEASKRSSVMAANISSGNIGADVRNDIVWRKNWVARLKETEESFHKIINAAGPPYTLYYSTDIKTGNVNYQTETADLSIFIDLSANWAWFKSLNRTLQAVLAGLNATNRKNDWELAGWPQKGVSETNPFASPKKYDIAVAFELVNQQGRVIGNQTVKLNPAFDFTGPWNYVKFASNTLGAVNFNGVKADNISDNLTIRVASVNGTPPQDARFTIVTMPVGKPQPFVDKRDGKRYNTVRFGSRVWMAENLNYQSKSGNSWCYENQTSNCDKYGMLYDWRTAMAVCPAGWHLPARDEWNYLVEVAGGKNVAGKKLKAKNDWSKNGNGTDDFGFSALPGGYRDTDGSFYLAGDYGYWWTATARGSGNAYNRGMGYYGDNLYERNDGVGVGLSVRCVGD